MKKSKNKVLIVVTLLILLVIGILSFVLIFSANNKNSLTLAENKWIDSNKYNVIDVALISDMPIISYNGTGIVYDFLEYVTNKLSLKFNVIPYKIDNTVDYQYKMNIKDSASIDDIVLLKDNMVLVTKEKNIYTSVKSIPSMKVGVLSSDYETLNNYLKDNNINFVQLESYKDLKNSLVVSETSSVTPSVDAIIIPKVIITKEMIEKDFKISYQFNDINKYIVLETNGLSELNSILKKKFNVWKEKYYENSYDTNLLDSYYSFKKLTDVEQKKLQSKSYKYGFIDYGIFNNLNGNNISGYNELLLKGFNKFSDLSIDYTKYNSLSKLLKDFNSGEIDFVMDIVDMNGITIETNKTIGTFNKNLAVVSGYKNKDTIESLYSLKNKEVLTIKNSYLEKYLAENDIKVKSYNNLKDLITDFSDKDIVLIDLDNYNYYKTSAFKDSKINYLIDVNEKYSFIISSKNTNNEFKNIFEFYLNYISYNELISSNYDTIKYKNINVVYILLLIIIALCAYLVLDLSSHIKIMIKKLKKNRSLNLSKEDKLKYIDQLTSLKNRAYLNSRIEKWDNSEIYPQAVIIIDLNNISYINDNYGREEGDKVITEAANILIQNQLQNSEIIRTDGNEFLIYLVNYNEKQIIAYLRKLNKELKDLSHGFGAASGYSIITDAIKTFDDAVNEATIEMKTNKEDINY